MSGRPGQPHEYLHCLKGMHPFSRPGMVRGEGFSAQLSLDSLISNRRAGERCDPTKGGNIAYIGDRLSGDGTQKCRRPARSVDKNVAPARELPGLELLSSCAGVWGMAIPCL